MSSSAWEGAAAPSRSREMRQEIEDHARRRGALIAVVGADGSGKSTLTRELEGWISDYRPVRRAYLGLGTGNIGRRIGRFRVGGRRLEQAMTRRADRARDAEDRIPGIPTALVMFLLTALRYWRFRRAWRQVGRGFVVLTDRYPQGEFAGIYDGPLLLAARAEGWLVRRLAEWERALYRRMASPPNLVIKLHVKVETALDRKPDHRPASIARKVEITRRLTFDRARIVDLDADRPYAQVLAAAKAVIGGALRLDSGAEDWPSVAEA